MALVARWLPMQQAIISSLYRFGSSPLPAPDGQSMSLEALQRRADQLIATHQVSGGRMYDLCRLGRELLNLLLAERPSPICAALIIHRVFTPIPIGDRATLALYVTNALRSDRLSKLASGALFTLRGALAFEDPEATAEAVRRLDEELGHRTHLSPTGLFVANRVTAPLMQAALEQVTLSQRSAPKHLVILVPLEEEGTPLEVMREHLRLVLRYAADLDDGNLLYRSAVSLLQTRRLSARPSALTMALMPLRALARWVWPPLPIVAPRIRV